MKTTFSCLALILFMYPVFTQSSIDIRLGTGISNPGIRDIKPITIENEINIHHNRMLTTSLGLNYGIGRNKVFEFISSFQGNANLLLSPFGMDQAVDIRLGSGFSYWHRLESLLSDAGTPSHIPLENYSFNQLGINAIAETSFALTSKTLFGVKFMGQWYKKRQYLFTVLLKYGIQLK